MMCVACRAAGAGCPSLRHLSLMGCKKISDKSITEIANHTTNLASLRVSSERVTGTSLALLLHSRRETRIDVFLRVSCVLRLQTLRWF